MDKKYFNQHLLKEQANFYNQNYDVFKSIEDNYKLDIWFLEIGRAHV